MLCDVDSTLFENGEQGRLEYLQGYHPNRPGATPVAIDRVEDGPPPECGATFPGSFADLANSHDLVDTCLQVVRAVGSSGFTTANVT